MLKERVLLVALLFAFLGFVLMSPRIEGYLLAWVAPGALLFFTRKVDSFWKAALLGISVLFLSGIIANWMIIPLAAPIYFIVVGVLSIVGIIPYLLDRMITKNLQQLTALLGFPVMMVLLEYFNSLGDNGVWGSIAHTQFDFALLLILLS